MALEKSKEEFMIRRPTRVGFVALVLMAMSVAGAGSVLAADITVNANAVWHAESGSWVIDPHAEVAEEHGAFCRDCDASCEIIEIKD